jgi:DNA-directed RNA polymerase subunit H (RpoH/RPB5)
LDHELVPEHPTLAEDDEDRRQLVEPRVDRVAIPPPEAQPKFVVQARNVRRRHSR